MRGKGEGSIFKDARGLWTAIVELPPKDGKRRRKVIRSKDKRTVIAKLGDLQRDLKKRGDLPTADQTVAEWFYYWLDRIAAAEVRPKTLAGYRSAVLHHVIPEIGSVRLERLTAAHLRRVTDAAVEKGAATSYALGIHRIMSSALEKARREGRIGENPATMTSAPRKSRPDIEAFTLDESLELLAQVVGRPDGIRWATSLLTAARRGEVLGLERDRVTSTLDISWQLQRIPWRHGCNPDPGRRAYEVAPCGAKRGVDCDRRTLSAPHDWEHRRLEGGLYLSRPKSSAGWRIIPLVDPLRSMLERHMAVTDPGPHGLLFPRADGRPIDPDQDSRAWRNLLAETGIERDVNQHGLRHTAIDLLYLAGVPEDVIQAIVGQSVLSVTRGYRTRGEVQMERLRVGMSALSAPFLTPSDPGTPRAIAS
jgi:integrase